MAPEGLIANHFARGFKRSAADESKSAERPIANYLAMLEHLDNEPGRLLAKLDELKLRDNTLVIFTSETGGLLRLLTQTGTLQRPALFRHMPTYTTNDGRTPGAAIREGDWKLIHWFGDYLDTTGFTPDDKP